MLTKIILIVSLNYKYQTLLNRHSFEYLDKNNAYSSNLIQCNVNASYK